MARWRKQKIRVGDIYEDCDYHPVLCTESSRWDVAGISLIDGTTPRSCSVEDCAIRKLSLSSAVELREVWDSVMPVRLRQYYYSDPKLKLKIISLSAEYCMTISQAILSGYVRDKFDIFVSLNTYFEASGEDMNEISPTTTEVVVSLILIQLYSYGYVTFRQVLELQKTQPASL